MPFRASPDPKVLLRASGIPISVPRYLLLPPATKHVTFPELPSPIATESFRLLAKAVWAKFIVLKI